MQRIDAHLFKKKGKRAEIESPALDSAIKDSLRYVTNNGAVVDNQHPGLLTSTNSPEGSQARSDEKHHSPLSEISYED